MENLKNYGVHSLNAEEMREVNGGNWIKVLKYVKDAVVSGAIWDGLKWIAKNGGVPEPGANGYMGCKR